MPIEWPIKKREPTAETLRSMANLIEWTEESKETITNLRVAANEIEWRAAEVRFLRGVLMKVIADVGRNRANKRRRLWEVSPDTYRSCAEALSDTDRNGR